MLPKMPSRTATQLARFTLKTISAAVFAATLVSSASAAGLGRLTVLSALGQPLNAEIELTAVGKDEAGSLTAKLASAEAFRQANIEFNPALFSVRFGIEQRGSRQFIRVTSAQPINEPYVDMLLELGGSNGRLVREYTFLLDPADLRSGQVTAPISAPVAAPVRAPFSSQVPAASASPSAASSAPANNGRRAKSDAPTSAARGTPVGNDTPSANGGGAGEKSYMVKNGDSLARIANKVRSGGVSLDQMLVALYRANPNAFVGENMNRMRAGQILSVPSAESVKSVDTQEARGVVVTQARDFSNYRNKLAGQVAAAVPQKPVESKQVVGGKITTTVDESKTSASESKDKLKLSKAGGAPLAQGAINAASVSAGEEKIAKDKAIAEANSRVKELEKNVSELQKVLEVKNKDLAEQQKKADLAAKTAASTAAAALAASKANLQSASTPVPAKIDSGKITAPLVVTPPVIAKASPAIVARELKPTVPSATVAAVPTVLPQLATPTPVASAPVTTSALADTPAVPQKAATVVSTPKPVVQASLAKPAADSSKPKVKVPVAAVAETSFLDDLLSNALLLPALGVLLVGLGAFGIFTSRRKKKNQQFEDSILTDSNLKANSLFGSTGGQSVDTNNSVFNSNFAPSASQLDANEVDPVAEADVYIAYGRDAQAEEILKEALRTQPDRNAVRLKLLEIYAHRKDVRSFELMASELFGMTKGEGDDWAQAATMGLALDPNNPLYAGGKSAPALAQPVVPNVTTTASDDLDLEALLATTQINTLAGSANTIAPEVAHLHHQDLDLNTASFLDGAAAKAAVSIPGATHADDGLDFDLEGLGIQDVESHEVLANPAVLTSDAHNAHAMEFVSPTLVPAEKIQAVDFTETKFEPATLHGHTADAGKLAAVAAASAIAAGTAAAGHHAAEAHASAASSAVLEPMLHFGTPATADAAAHGVATAPVIGSEHTKSAVHPDPLDFDLSAISLDLNPNEPHVPHMPSNVTPTTHQSALMQSTASGAQGAYMAHDSALENADTLVLEDDEISTTPEMATKLELAIAYEEIGDKDGARELLDEVIKGGFGDQVTQARAMMAKLG